VAARPSAAEKVSLVASPDYGNTTHTHAEEGQAEFSGQAERSGDGGLGGLFRQRQRRETCRLQGKQALALL
jgi:hypothetical protein